MFRTTLLSLVLILAAGQNGRSFCEVWCHAEQTTGPCEHHRSTAPYTMRDGNDCSVSDGAVVFVRVEDRTSESSVQVEAAVVVAPFTHPILSATSARRANRYGLSPGERPPQVSLRI